MDDLQYGTRDKRGHWSPKEPPQIAPLWDGPCGMMMHFVIYNLWPWNTMHVAVTLAYSFRLTATNHAPSHSLALA